ncbi:InlB B-repeat-containing protein [Vescimonas sanitatis]|uniref:InlB B-repeat-containing protein n=1 Tax=Vescimonas sanitatis TaxID=3376993 RepID=UPI003B7BE505
MKRRFLALVLAGCLAAVLSTAAWAMSPTGFYLNVELPSGKTIALDVESGDSIDNVKEELEMKTKIAAGEQHLYYGGKLLVDGRTLANYNIQKGSTLLLTTKIKGTPAGEKLTEENMSGSTIGAPVTISEKTLNSGTYYLCNNVKLTQALVIQGDVTLDLNGFVLQHENRDANDSVIQMDSGTLTLVDSNPDAIHKFVKEATGLWTLNENAGTEIVKGGVITGGIGREHSFSSVYGSISENGGGGVFINQDASFVMEGGNIVGCSAVGEHNTAGGVLVARSASFVMKAGKIAGCTAARGGGVYVADRDGDYALGSFTMNGGTIEWCVAYGSAAYDDGGGVNNLGSFTMNGGTIRNCTAAYGYGGGISSLRNITICGDAFVRDCTASQDKSSAMYLNPSNPADRAVIEGGTFRGNIYASPYCTGMVAVTGGTFDPGQPNGITLHTVTFNSNGGSDVPGQIRANAAATKPADPTRSGYVFAGWYTNEACTAAYDFTQPVTNSVTLYAKWEAAPRYYYNSGTTETGKTDENKKGSPKTFDPGVGIYAVSVALSLTGTAWIGRKRH